MKRTDALIRKKIGPASKKALEVAIEENQKSAVALSFWIGAVKVLVPSGVFAVLAGSQAGVLPAGVVMGCVLLVFTVAAWAKYDAVGISARWWALRAGVLLRVASLLDRKRPLHPFRYIALTLFTVGSFIDLTAGGVTT